MKLTFSSAFGVFLLSCCATWAAEEWTRFRGPNGSGVSEGKLAPTSWDATTNLRWKVDLPGPGASSPVVFGDRVYVTCYTGYGVVAENPGTISELKRHLICLNRNDGAELWRATVDSEHDEDVYEGFITEHGYASSTPATDGNRVFVHFGKTGLFAFDTDGKRLWKTHVGTKSDPAKWGDGASCMLYKDLVILNAGNTDHALIALNQSDGSEAWRVTDPKFTNSWSTPIIVEVEGRDELVVPMPGKILGYDPATGKELWFAESPIDETVCGSCVVGDGAVYAMGGREGRAIAVKLGGKGDVTSTHVLWKQPLRSGIGTPIVANGRLYWASRGIAYCADCKTGEYLFKERFKNEAAEPAARRPAGDYASPVAIGDKLLMTARNGTVHIIEAAAEFKYVGGNSFGDESRFSGTPAIRNDQIFIRSDQTLYCVSEN
jgi:outer membrane protein assembly factor BamB